MKRTDVVMIGLALGAVLGCARERVVGPPLEPKPDYARPLAAGSEALRLITDPARMPDLPAAYRNSDALLAEAVDLSLAWFAAPSSRQFFPTQGITHRQAQASLLAMGDLLAEGPSEEAFVADVGRLFDIYESVGYDGWGTVLFTGYYSPVFRASRTPTGPFVHPLYKRPGDLATVPVTGEPLGRRLGDGSIVPYFTRARIEESRMFAGNELVWLDDPLSVYIVHVNGSAKLRLTGPGESGFMFVGYAGKTDRPYTGLGQLIVEQGLLRRDELSLPAIKRIYRRDPKLVMDLIYGNENYVFFTQYQGDNWPAGSLGVRVTPERTLATDKKIYPRGGLVLVDTKAVTFSEGQRKFLQFMLDQDTGGAIQAPGRADIFMGIGKSAEILAGGQYAEGRLYYFFLKPQYVDQYLAPDLSDAPR
ncbi:MAG: MltA domain-containing protein [Planctomycetes bacterium]|nr:MltA domain-containing protein [Planctomycetota bacterium]